MPRKAQNKKSPSDVPTPQIVLINKIPIYIQKLTAAQAVANGIVGWDQVLADVEQLFNEAAVRSHRFFLGHLEATAPADSARTRQKTPSRKDWSKTWWIS